jgi:hypothetical protein
MSSLCQNVTVSQTIKKFPAFKEIKNDCVHKNQVEPIMSHISSVHNSLFCDDIS